MSKSSAGVNANAGDSIVCENIKDIIGPVIGKIIGNVHLHQDIKIHSNK